MHVWVQSEDVPSWGPKEMRVEAASRTDSGGCFGLVKTYQNYYSIGM